MAHIEEEHPTPTSPAYGAGTNIGLSADRLALAIETTPPKAESPST